MIYITSCSALWHKLNTSAFHFITWCHAGNSWDAASFKWFLSELSWMPTNCRKVNKLPKTWNMQNTDLHRIITEEHVMYMFVWFQLDLSPLPWLLPFVRSQNHPPIVLAPVKFCLCAKILHTRTSPSCSMILNVVVNININMYFINFVVVFQGISRVFQGVSRCFNVWKLEQFLADKQVWIKTWSGNSPFSFAFVRHLFNSLHLFLFYVSTKGGLAVRSV